MPGLNEHCRHTKKRYGYDFRLIHRWMDEPYVLIWGKKHRQYRHDALKTPKQAKAIFFNKIPEEYRINIENAVLDHLLLDKEGSAKLKKRWASGIIEMDENTWFSLKVQFMSELRQQFRQRDPEWDKFMERSKEFNKRFKKHIDDLKKSIAEMKEFHVTEFNKPKETSLIDYIR